MNNNFEKNRLDLAYQRQLTYLNAILLLSTIGLLSFVGIFIWNREFFNYGLLFLIIIALISTFWYKKVNNTLIGISNKIKELQ